MKKTIHKLLPEIVNAQVAYTGRKLSTCFQIKDKSKFDHQHDLVYHAKCLVNHVTKIIMEETINRTYQNTYLKLDMNM